MSTSNEDNSVQKDKQNTDPLTGEPGAHPVSTGIGAAGGTLAGIAAGTAVGGPVGGVIGAVIAGVAGGYGGKAVGEGINPTEEDAYWREHHDSRHFGGASYDDYAPAYRSGFEGYSRHLDSGRDFDDIEDDLRNDYERAGSTVPWENARGASRMAWDRVATRGARSEKTRMSDGPETGGNLGNL